MRNDRSHRQFGATELADDWGKVVNILNENADLRTEVNDMLAELEPM